MSHRRSRKRSQRRSRKRSHRRSHKRSRRLSRRRQSRRHSRYRFWPFGKSKVAPAPAPVAKRVAAKPVAAAKRVATAPVKPVAAKRVATPPVKPVAAAQRVGSAPTQRPAAIAFNSRRRKGGRSKHRWDQLRKQVVRKSRRK